jgi:hypothetical protein
MVGVVEGLKIFFSPKNSSLLSRIWFLYLPGYNLLEF